MAKFEAKGINNLLKKFDNLSNTPSRVKNKIVMDAGNVILQQQKDDAKSLFKGTGRGANALAICKERTGEGYIFLDIGISSKNWRECRGLWFQHYGFYSKSATLWLTKSFKKAKPKVNRHIKESLSRELKL